MLRVQNGARHVLVETLERGLKTLIDIPFDEIEALQFEQSASSAVAAAAMSAAADFATECPGCGERFATDNHRRRHQVSCPLYHQSAAVGVKRPRAAQTVTLHLGLRSPPGFWREFDVDPLLPLQLVPCEDPTVTITLTLTLAPALTLALALFPNPNPDPDPDPGW